MAESDDTTGPTAFRDAIRHARREAVEVPPLHAPAAGPAPAPGAPAAVLPESLAIELFAAPLTLELVAPPPRSLRFEYRVERTRGSRKRRARAFAKLGRRGWELVSVDDGYAYLKRPRP